MPVIVFVLPTRPGECRCLGGRRHRGIRALWPFSITVLAVTGAVKAVGGAVTGTVPAVTRGRDPCAGRGRHRACRACRGRSSLAVLPDRRPRPLPLAKLESLSHETLAFAPEIAFALRGMSSHARFSRSQLSRLRSRRCSLILAAHAASVVPLWPAGPGRP